MRLMLPAAGYKLLKNSKNARLCRQREKQKRQGDHSEFEKVMTENERLRAIIDATEAKLQKACQKLR